MKKLLFKIIIGICSLFGAEIFGQTNENIINPIEKSVKLDLAGFLDHSLMIEFEKPIGDQSSYSLSTGVKWYPESPNLETGKIINKYTKIQEKERTSLFIFFGTTKIDTTIKIGEPIERIQEFTPTYSIPFQHSFRYYFNPKNKSRFYMNAKLLNSINQGYKVEYKTTQNEFDKDRKYNYGSWIASSNSFTTVTETVETQTISKGMTLSTGIGLGIGLNTYISKNFVLDFAGEVGANFINGHRSYSNSMLGSQYAKLKMLVGFRL